MKPVVAKHRKKCFTAFVGEVEGWSDGVMEGGGGEESDTPYFIAVKQAC